MTREEKLDWLYRLKSEIFVYMPKEWLISMADALDDAIKSLEQEPVIDKIRAEIDNALSDGMIHKKTVLGIIDKYKGEVEV